MERVNCSAKFAMTRITKLRQRSIQSQILSRIIKRFTSFPSCSYFQFVTRIVLLFFFHSTNQKSISFRKEIYTERVRDRTHVVVATSLYHEIRLRAGLTGSRVEKLISRFVRYAQKLRCATHRDASPRKQ